jgi:hypothetical protein
LKEDATLRWLILKKVNRISLELLKGPFRKCCFKKGQMNWLRRCFDNTNTRVSYPIYHIDNIQPSSIGKI